MKKWLVAVVSLFILGGVAQAADPERWVGTGDKKLDTTLKAMNAEAKGDPDNFLRQLSARHGIPEQELRRTQESHGLCPADLFMSSAMARATGKPVSDVAERYKKSEGKGWGVTAQEMGIKPGSKAFQEMKKGAQGNLEQLKARNRERHRHQQGEAKKAQEKKKYEESRGPGQDQEQGQGQGQGQGQSKGQGKGKGR